MAKKKKGETEAVSKDVLKALDKHIQEVDIYEHSEECTCRSGANVNLARAFPSIEDGLKLSYRRILYCLYVNNRSNKVLKVNKIVGDVLGDYHPHGDEAVVDTIVRMANFWEMPYPLIEGSGNFGSIKTGSGTHGAQRYIHGKMSEFAKDCYFSEWTDNIVDMKDNYDGTLLEPEYLPCKYPMSLINGTMGIGYSIATSVPTFNFEEVCRHAIALMEDPDYEFLLIPDSPLDCEIIMDKGNKGVENLNFYGAGAQYKYRAYAKVITDKRSGKDVIKIGPYLPFKSILVNKNYRPGVKNGETAGFLNKLKEYIKDKKLTGISDYAINNKKIGKKELPIIDLELIIKSGFNPYDILNNMYNLPGLLTSGFHANMRYVVGLTQNKLFNPKEALQKWIDIRRVTKSRIVNNKLSKALKREHSLKIILDVVDTMNVDDIIHIMKTSKDSDMSKERLMKEMGMTSIQANTVSNMTFTSFNENRVKGYREEYESIKLDVRKYMELKSDVSKIDQIIIEELEAGIRKWAKPRSAKIISNIKQKIIPMECILSMSPKGFIKKTPKDVASVGKIGKNEQVSMMLPCNNVDELIIATAGGKGYRLAVNDIPLSEKSDIGYDILQYCSIPKDDRVISTMNIADLSKKDYFITITKEGLVRKISKDLIKDTRNNTYLIKLNKTDELVDMYMANDDEYIITYTNEGRYIMVPIADVPELATKLSRGSRVMTLEDGDFITGADITNTTDIDRLVITSKGNLKIISRDNFNASNRAGKAYMLAKLDSDDRIIRVTPVDVTKDEEVKLRGKSGDVIIPLKDIPVTSRNARGAKLVNQNELF